VPFRTWRNTNTGAAADELSDLFAFNVPLRWSISQYYQAILNGEAHVKDVAFLTTLAGYVHYRLTGKRVLGIGDASGMFPISDGNYDRAMLEKFDTVAAKKGHFAPLESLLPKVLSAGENAGTLTEAGAKWLAGYKMWVCPEQLKFNADDVFELKITEAEYFTTNEYGITYEDWEKLIEIGRKIGT
jgi:sugar (pentulose or hexulose) kinase